MNSWIAKNQSNGSGPGDSNFDERVSDLIAETVGGRSRARTASSFRSSYSAPNFQTSRDRIINHLPPKQPIASQFGPFSPIHERRPFPSMQQYKQPNFARIFAKPGSQNHQGVGRGMNASNESSLVVSEDNFERWHRHMIQAHPEPGNGARQLAKLVKELPSNRFCRAGSDQMAEPRRTGSSHSQAPMFRENGLSRRDAGQQTTPQPTFEQNYGQNSHWTGPPQPTQFPPAHCACCKCRQLQTQCFNGLPPNENVQIPNCRKDSPPTHHSLSQVNNANASRLPHQSLAAQHFGSHPHHYQAHIPHVQQQHESAPFGHPPFFPQHCSQFCSTISSPNNARQQQSQFGHRHSSPSPIKRAPKSALKTPCRGASQAFSANGAHVTFGSPLFSVKLYTPPSGHSKSRQKRNHSRESNGTPKRPLSSQRQAFLDRTNM